MMPKKIWKAMQNALKARRLLTAVASDETDAMVADLALTTTWSYSALADQFFILKIARMKATDEQILAQLKALANEPDEVTRGALMIIWVAEGLAESGPLTAMDLQSLADARASLALGYSSR